MELESDLGVAFNIYGNEVLWDSTCVTQVYTYAPCAIRPPRLRCGRFTFTCRVIIIHQPSDITIITDLHTIQVNPIM